MDELQAIEDWAGALLGQLAPAARREAAKDIARTLRQSQQKRIAAQQNPDGTPYAPRKNRIEKRKNLRGKAGRIKRRAMFAKLRTARFFKAETDASGLSIGFAGRIARIARIHQEGQTAAVVPGGPEYTYPARVLLGFTASERELIRDKLLSHIVKP